MEKEEISKVMSILGKRSAKNMTKEQRVDRAKKAAEARWGKKKTV